jgi:hypothetical protein
MLVQPIDVVVGDVVKQVQRVCFVAADAGSVAVLLYVVLNTKASAKHTWRTYKDTFYRFYRVLDYRHCYLGRCDTM